MTTTAIYPNRIEDLKKVEDRGIPEFPDRPTTLLFQGVPVARSYQRVVFGDSGPYVELDLNDFILQPVKKFPDPQKPGIFYIWMYPQGLPKLKVYLQLKPVSGLKNGPPRTDGLPHQFNRVEGYADYKPGKFYIDAFQLVGAPATDVTG